MKQRRDWQLDTMTHAHGYHETEKAAGKRRIGERDGSVDGGDDVAKRQKGGISGRTKEIKRGPETAAKRQTSRRPHPWRGDAIDIYTAAMDNGNHTTPHSPHYPPPPAGTSSTAEKSSRSTRHGLPEVEETQALGIWTTGATQHNPSLVRFILTVQKNKNKSDTDLQGGIHTER